MPLRRLYILKLKLTFPSAVAAAYTIRSLHVGRNAAANARKKTLALILSFLLAILWRITSEYAPGIMWDWHWGWWFYRAGWKWIIAAENWVSLYPFLETSTVSYFTPGMDLGMDPGLRRSRSPGAHQLLRILRRRVRPWLGYHRTGAHSHKPRVRDPRVDHWSLPRVHQLREHGPR